jgi:hypothetical protein
MLKPEPHPLNVPGPFYVEAGLCMLCCVPEHEAPDLIGFYKDPTGTHRESHCYFRKQPQTPEELERAIAATRLACCGAYRYGGSNPEILKRLRQAGVAVEQIDALCSHDEERGKRSERSGKNGK